MRTVSVTDSQAAVENVSRPKADPSDASQVGAPMAGALVELRVKEGADVKKGDPLAVLSAMKMVSHLLKCALKLYIDCSRKWSSQHRTPARSLLCRSRKVIV